MDKIEKIDPLLQPKMRPLKRRRKVILITGASVGIGLALAKKLIKNDDYFLVLTARETSLFRFEDESIYEAKNIWLRDLDVLNHNQIKTTINEIIGKLGGVDILINNAGITDRSTVEDSSGIYRKVQMAVNYLAPFEIIGRVLSLMRKNKYGKIINISSAGGFMAMPTMSSYSASKFALEAASESLWYEMKPWNIHVTLIIPGFIDSKGFLNTTESNKCKSSTLDPTSTYHEHYKGMTRLISESMYSSISTNETIAIKICKIINMKDPPLRVYVTFDAWLFFWFRKILPPKIYHLIIYHFLPNIAKWGKQNYRK
ncbi:MAG: SDR family NAD(P)-dependent oxidoreductase [Bdellovibrionales bacterium]|nr:SDR family NAD(P)-dependent oxidoreductase [Bdellovibrionales bacterium]